MNRDHTKKRRPSRLTPLLVLSLVGGTGCSLLPSEQSDPAPFAAAESKSTSILPWKKAESDTVVPAQIVATWTDTVLQESGRGATRGFGGRLYFYGSGETRPVAVEGQLVVYAFDEAGREPTNNKPTKRYVFPPEQFALHRSQSELGISYSFWLPWDGAKGSMTDVSLIARFEPLKGGALVVSDQSTVRLPGRFDGPSVVAEKPVTRQVRPVQTVSHEAPIGQPTAAAETPAPRRGVETTTIRLPRGSRAHGVVAGGSTAAGSKTTSVKYRSPAESVRLRRGQP